MAGKYVLGIDTCTRWTNLAVASADGCLLADIHELSETHATRLVAAVETLLRRCSVKYGEVAAVGAVVGPGSFTGLRVGLSAALGFSRTLGINAYGMDSLRALAECSPVDGPGMAVLDARRREVYAGRFVRSGSGVTALGGAEARPPSEAVPTGFCPSWAIGDGVPLVEGLPDGCALFPDVPNLAIPAARRAARAFSDGGAGEALNALYVRPPDAKLP